jgi:hypothetical protein
MRRKVSRVTAAHRSIQQAALKAAFVSGRQAPFRPQELL